MPDVYACQNDLAIVAVIAIFAILWIIWHFKGRKH